MLFRKNKQRSNASALKDKIAIKVANSLLKMQVRVSNFMSACIKKIPAKSLKILLVVFCLLGGGSSIYVIKESIFKANKQQRALKIDPLQVPQYYDQSGSAESRVKQTVDPQTYEALLSFERYMDSLQQTRLGRKLHDSILITRPGLMDSIKMLKEIFNSQIK